MSALAPILLVDDKDFEEPLIRRALQKAGVPNLLIALHDGRQAVDYLAGSGPYRDRMRFPLPVFVLLDLHLPVLDGFEVLKWRQTRPALADLPLLAFSTSTSEFEIRKASRLGAQEFLHKPTDYYQMIAALKGVAERWLKPLHSAPLPCLP